MFIKVPRKHAINHDNTPIVSIYVNSLKELLKKGKNKGSAELHQVRSECYTFDGKVIQPKHIGNINIIEKLMKRVGSITKDFLPANFLRGYENACLKVPHLKKFSTGLFSAIATGINAYLCQHVDEDSFWSTTFIHCDDEQMLDNDQKYKLNVPVACYFVFGTLGYAVALRQAISSFSTHVICIRTVHALNFLRAISISTAVLYI